MESRALHSQQKYVARWLGICCLMVVLMVWLGGMTRLTESGLAITEWHPVAGIFPPLSAQAWGRAFQAYQQSPEYIKKNYGMTPGAFKAIFWIEYIHRLAGRVAGAVFILPALFFFLKGYVSRGISIYLFGLAGLGLFQGAVGWWMVKSGLQYDPHVHPLWLAFHLVMAFLIFALLFYAWGRSVLLPRLDGTIPRFWRWYSYGLPFFIGVQVLLGALVAGTHAGLIYNTFPDMQGEWVPEGMWMLTPWYRNFWENVALIQFLHRGLAYSIVFLVVGLWWACHHLRFPSVLCKAVNVAVMLVFLQFLLGVATLLFQVPLVLASLHQVGALAVFAQMLYIGNIIRANDINL